MRSQRCDSLSPSHRRGIHPFPRSGPNQKGRATIAPRSLKSGVREGPMCTAPRSLCSSFDLVGREGERRRRGKERGGAERRVNIPSTRWESHPIVRLPRHFMPRSFGVVRCPHSPNFECSASILFPSYSAPQSHSPRQDEEVARELVRFTHAQARRLLREAQAMVGPFGGCVGAAPSRRHAEVISVTECRSREASGRGKLANERRVGKITR